MVRRNRKPKPNKENPSNGDEGILDTPEQAKGKTKHKGKKKKKGPIKAELTKFKFVEEIDKDHIMEYGLSEDEIMSYRKHNFKLSKPPIYEVRTTKSSEMKEELSSYCGKNRKTIKNWLYWV